MKSALADLVPPEPETTYWSRVVALTDSLEGTAASNESADLRIVVRSASQELHGLAGAGKSNWSKFLRAPVCYFTLFGDVT